jgi:hypothetical protein
MACACAGVNISKCSASVMPFKASFILVMLEGVVVAMRLASAAIIKVIKRRFVKNIGPSFLIQKA